jgi:hypothetical protein
MLQIQQRNNKNQSFINFCHHVLIGKVSEQQHSLLLNLFSRACSKRTQEAFALAFGNVNFVHYSLVQYQSRAPTVKCLL